MQILSAIFLTTHRMIEIFRKKYGLRIREVYFSTSMMPSDRSRDLDVYVQHTCPLPGMRPFWTACLDLCAAESDLLSGIARNFRYEINRAAQKDELLCQVTYAPETEALSKFSRFYEPFAKDKLLSPANLNKLEVFRANGNLVLAEVVSKIDANVLAMHCYVVDGVRARLYYSATASRHGQEGTDRQLIGRANKLLHWEVIKDMKRAGIKCYDFGGISKTAQLKGIDDFKLQFGAQESQEANSVIAVSLLGKAVMAARTLVGAVREKSAS